MLNLIAHIVLAMAAGALGAWMRERLSAWLVRRHPVAFIGDALTIGGQAPWAVNVPPVLLESQPPWPTASVRPSLPESA